MFYVIKLFIIRLKCKSIAKSLLLQLMIYTLLRTMDMVVHLTMCYILHSMILWVWKSLQKCLQLTRWPYFHLNRY